MMWLMKESALDGLSSEEIVFLALFPLGVLPMNTFLLFLAGSAEGGNPEPTLLLLLLLLLLLPLLLSEEEKDLRNNAVDSG